MTFNFAMAVRWNPITNPRQDALKVSGGQMGAPIVCSRPETMRRRRVGARTATISVLVLSTVPGA